MKLSVPISLIVFALLAGSVLLVPNGMDGRLQRPVTFAIAMLAMAGLYVAYTMSVSGGLLILWTSLIATKTMYAETTTTLLILLGAVIFFVAIVLSRDEWQARKETLYDVLILIACLNLAYQVLQFFHVQAWPISQQAGTESMYVGMMSNINETSALFALCLPAFFRRNRLYLLPVCLVGIWLAHTTTGILASVVVLIVWAIIEYRKGWIAVTLAALIAGLVFISFVDPLNMKIQRDGRLYIYEKTAQAASVKLTGWGFGQYEKVIPIITSYRYIPAEVRNVLYSQVADKESFDNAAIKLSGNKQAYFTGDTQFQYPFTEAHNEFLEWWFISGVVGLALAGCFLIITLYRAFRHEADRLPMYGLLSASICAAFGFPWHIMSTALITVLWLGIVYGNREVITT